MRLICKPFLPPQFSRHDTIRPCTTSTASPISPSIRLHVHPSRLTYSTTSTGAGIVSARTFDLRVISRTESTDHIFSAISKEEEDVIKTYLKSKNVRVKDDLEELAMEVDEEEEEDEEEGISSDEGASIVSVDKDRGKGKSKGDGKKSQGAAGGKNGKTNDDVDESGK
jgi:hypothetical protein